MRFTLLFVFIAQLSSAQIPGVVKDSISGEPIPYVNIWIADSDKGISSDENGNYSLAGTFENALLVFSAIGYQTKKVKGDVSLVELNPVAYQLDAVQIEKPLGKKSIKLSGFNGSMFFYGSSWNMAKFFKADEKVLKHPFLKEITFWTDSDKDDCTVNLRLLKPGPDGAPGEDVLSKNILVPVTKGNHNTTMNVEKFHIKVPEEGIFIVIERLIIPENRLTMEAKAKSLSGGKRIIKSYSYEPEFRFLPSEINDTWNWTSSWNQHPKVHLSNPKAYENLLLKKFHDKFKTAALSITLTN